MRNFGFYFKKGTALTKMALKGKGVFTKLVLGLYLILSFFGKMFLFLRPIFLIADNNLAMMIVEAHDFEVNKLFEGVNSKKRYSSLLLGCLFTEGLVIAAVVIFTLPFIVWALIPTFYNYLVQPTVFISISAIFVVAIGIMLALVYSPMGFVAVKGKGLSAGDIMFLSKEGSKSIRSKVFFINFINYLVVTLVLGIFVLMAFLFIIFMRDDMGEVLLGANFLVMFVFLAMMFVDIFLLSFFKVSNLVSLYSLYFDSVETKHIVVSTRGATKEAYIPLFADDQEGE